MAAARRREHSRRRHLARLREFRGLEGPDENAAAASIMGIGLRRSCRRSPVASAVQALHDHQSGYQSRLDAAAVIDGTRVLPAIQDREGQILRSLLECLNWADVAKRYQGALGINNFWGLRRQDLGAATACCRESSQRTLIKECRRAGGCEAARSVGCRAWILYDQARNPCAVSSPSCCRTKPAR